MLIKFCDPLHTNSKQNDSSGNNFSVVDILCQWKFSKARYRGT